VLKDIFRKYPGKYESIIKDLCENLKQLDNAEARAAMIWIVGQYCEQIDNSVALMTDFAENFKEEAKNVQLAILNSSVKLYLKLEGEAEDLITSVLTQATEESDNPDLRNRGYIYWRMLAEDPEEAKNLILCEKPTISEDAGHLEPHLLEKLLDNISMLSSVYYKPPETFVKKIRDRINEQPELDEAEEGVEQEYVDSMGVKKSEYIKESENERISDYNDMIQQENILELESNPVDDLLSLGSNMAQQEDPGI
jgi:vesicle coat complex subunit